MRMIRKIEPVTLRLRKRKRVVAYARVSMETERLKHSLSAQISFYSEFIQKNPEWEYVGVYADDGISGTKTDKRKNFLKMIADCEAGLIDIILTKSISRFARNTVDLLDTVRKLRERGIEVRFEKERINTLSGDGELMLTILASFAQEESRSISDNVKWGIRKRFEQGITNGRFRIFGYKWKDDALIVQSDEAVIVKRIFQNFLDGKSRLETEREFAEEGITTLNGCMWRDSNIKNVLTNITYTGNQLLQKEYITDPISKRRKKNHGELGQYYVENHHEPIIDMETFQFVQSEMAKRAELGFKANKSLKLSVFSGLIKCEHCGCSYIHSRSVRKSRNTTEDVWVCATKKNGKGKCPVYGNISNKVLEKTTADVLGISGIDGGVVQKHISYISVPERYILRFHMNDGQTLEVKWYSEAKRERWTDELKSKQHEWMRRYMRNDTMRFSPFTTRIKCGVCGGAFEKGRYHSKYTPDKSYIRWKCKTAQKCSVVGIDEEELKRISAMVMGTDTFDEGLFRETMDSITFYPAGIIEFIACDGNKYTAMYNIKRRTKRYGEKGNSNTGNVEQVSGSAD